VLGLSAGGKPGEPPPAPLPSAHEPEHQALAQELVERSASARQVKAQAEPEPQPLAFERTSPAPSHGSPITAAMLAATGISLLLTLLRLRRRTHQLDQQTLRDAHRRLNATGAGDGKATLDDFARRLISGRSK
jgi:hypothetical protein